MRKKPVFCFQCGFEHMLQDRVKAEDYSGMDYDTVCPQCGSEGVVNTLSAYLKVKEAREKAHAQ